MHFILCLIETTIRNRLLLFYYSGKVSNKNLNLLSISRMTNRLERGCAPQFDTSDHVVCIFIYIYILYIIHIGHSIRSSYNFHGASLLYDHFVAAALIPVVSSNFFWFGFIFRRYDFSSYSFFPFLVVDAVVLAGGKREMWISHAKHVEPNADHSNRKQRIRTDLRENELFTGRHGSSRLRVISLIISKIKNTTFFFRHCFV